VDDFDSPTADDGAPTQPSAESGDDARQAEQTTAAEPSQTDKTSESERLRGLMSTVGKKESEKQAALAERDAAIAERDEAASALAEMQAEYDAFMAGYVEPEAPAVTQPVADPDAAPEPRPYISPVLQQNSGQMPANPIAQPRPQASDADVALRGMEQAYAEHLRGLN
jgi:hypothetical protein